MNAKTLCLKELEAGHLGMAIKIVEENHLAVDKQLKKAAIEACITSLERHFHWIIPLFVSVFGIANERKMRKFAEKLLRKALKAQDHPLAAMIGKTFNIRLDSSVEQAAKEMVLAAIDRQAEELGAIVITNDSHKYNFDSKK